jgi:hypothetical protein
MWAAAPECWVLALQLCVLHETRYSGTPELGHFVLSGPRIGHGKDTDC